MAEECKHGEFTLIWNGEHTGHPVGLTREQHNALQAFVAALSKSDPLQVVKTTKVIYQAHY